MAATTKSTDGQRKHDPLLAPEPLCASTCHVIHLLAGV